MARILRPIVNRIVPGEPLDVTVRSGLAAGIRIEIDPRLEKYYWTGSYEIPVQRALRDVLRPGDVMWDVGAHSGFHSAIASRLVGPDGLVVAFEPHPTNLRRLRRTIELNGLDNVVVKPAAVADTIGWATFHESERSSMGSLIGTGGDGRTFRVATTTLDFESSVLPAPTLVKLDIEGGECAAFRAADRLLSQIRPTLIVEFLTAQRLSAVAGPLTGYRVRALDDRNFLVTPAIAPADPDRSR